MTFGYGHSHECFLRLVREELKEKNTLNFVSQQKTELALVKEQTRNATN